MDNVIETKSFDFAVRIVNLYKHLTQEKGEYVLAKQVLRSGTSIGANVSEAQKMTKQSRFQRKNEYSAKGSIRKRLLAPTSI